MRLLLFAGVLMAASRGARGAQSSQRRSDDDDGDRRTLKCTQLRPGQYECPELSRPAYQRSVSCGADGWARLRCHAAPGIYCEGLVQAANGTDYFEWPLACRPTGDRDWHVALLLSVFGGWLGLDRFYLGYVATGLFKLLTFGCFLLWHLVDIVLIALQILQPADGSAYAMNDMAPRYIAIHLTNQTYFS